MRKGFFVLLFVILIVTTGCNQNSNVLATINDEEISKAELETQMVLTQISYGVNGVDFPSTGGDLRSLEERMLQNMVENRVLVDVAKISGIKIEEEKAKTQRDSLIVQMIASYESEEDYEAFLKEKKQSRVEFDEYLMGLARENEYIYQLYLQVTEDVSVTNDEVKSYYESNKKNYTYGEDQEEEIPWDEIKGTVELDLLNQKKAEKYETYFNEAKKGYDIKVY